MGLVKSPAVISPTSDQHAAAPAPSGDSPRTPNTSAIGQESFNGLLDALLELKEYHELERDPGRSSWLEEIIEDLSTAIAQLEPPDERATPM